MKDKLSGDDKEELKKKSSELKEMIGKDDLDSEAVKTKTDELSKSLQEKGAKMYQQAAKEVDKEEKGKDGDKEKDDDDKDEKEEEDKDEDKEDDEDEDDKDSKKDAEEGEVVE